MGASLEEVVTGAENLGPFLLLKAVVNSVTFRWICDCKNFKVLETVRNFKYV